MMNGNHAFKQESAQGKVNEDYLRFYIEDRDGWSIDGKNRYTDKGMKYQQALHASGLSTIEADGTLEIQTGFKNKKDSISYMAMAHKGDMCMTAEDGWIRIYGKNIVLEAADKLVLEGDKVVLGNKASQTYLLGKHIELGDEKDTTEIKVINSKRITKPTIRPKGI